MSFDLACKNCEVLGGVWEQIIRNAALFLLDDRADIPTVVSEMSDDEWNDFNELFCLPFQHVAFELEGKIVGVLSDPSPEARGLFGVRRKFIASQGNVTAVGEFEMSSPSPRLTHVELWNLQIVEGGIVQPRDTKFVRAANSMRNTLIILIATFQTLNLPSRFVVEIVPPKVRPADAPKIPRKHERATYALLTPGQIRKLHGGTQAHASPAPHQRRRHLRRLASDRFVNKKGSIITIAATWVGDETFSVGRRTYKIRLDV